MAMLDGMVPFNSMDGACFLAGAPAPERDLAIPPVEGSKGQPVLRQ